MFVVAQSRAQILFYWIYGAQSEINFHFYEAQLQKS